MTALRDLGYFGNWRRYQRWCRQPRGARLLRGGPGRDGGAGGGWRRAPRQLAALQPGVRAAAPATGRPAGEPRAAAHEHCAAPARPACERTKR